MVCLREVFLGPILFLLYINDLPSEVLHSKVEIYIYIYIYIYMQMTPPLVTPQKWSGTYSHRNSTTA